MILCVKLLPLFAIAIYRYAVFGAKLSFCLLGYLIAFARYALYGFDYTAGAKARRTVVEECLCVL